MKKQSLRPSKSDLLEELESIHASLLSQSSEVAPAQEPTKNITAPSKPTPKPVTGSQTSLFGDEVTLKELPNAIGENPFLPEHIRERLNRKKVEILGDLSQVSHDLQQNEELAQQLSKHHTADISNGVSEAELILEELIDTFLPQIRAELKKRLLLIVEKEILEVETEK